MNSSDNFLTNPDGKTRQMKYKSIQYRQAILEMIFNSKSGHTGGSLSCVDILNVLYNHTMNITPENFGNIDRDHYVQSKSNSV